MLKMMTPEEVFNKKTIPIEVFNCINEIIIKKYYNGKVEVRYDEITNLLQEKYNMEFDKNWHHFELICKNVGWQVKVIPKGGGLILTIPFFTLLKLKKKKVRQNPVLPANATHSNLQYHFR